MKFLIEISGEAKGERRKAKVSFHKLLIFSSDVGGF